MKKKRKKKYQTVNYMYSTFCIKELSFYYNLLIDLLCLTTLSAIFQLYHGDQF